MNSRIYVGEVAHERHWPTVHRFAYPLYVFACDLDELTDLDRKSPLFGYNRIRPFAIHDADYGLQREGSLRTKIDAQLAAADVPRPARVLLVTSARYFNYVFNPVSF